MTVYIAADHNGYEMKEALKVYLEKNNYEVKDLGAHAYIKKDDYPDFAHALAKEVAHDQKAKGILICGSGQGVCIVANKKKGIRAAQSWDEKTAHASRNDDDVNVLCLGAHYTSIPKAKKIAKVFLETKFKGAERFKRRIGKIE